jgi:TetR/AcrR family fatty acid metabolism transcriptional regulator
MSPEKPALPMARSTFISKTKMTSYLAVVFQIELRSSTKFMEQFSATKVTQYLDMIGKVIEEGQTSGVFRNGLNTKVVAKVLFGALDEMATNWVLSHKRYNLASMAEPVIDVLLNGITGT